MKNYEGIMSIGNMELKDLVIEESPNSLIVTASRTICTARRGLSAMPKNTVMRPSLITTSRFAHI